MGSKLYLIFNLHFLLVINIFTFFLHVFIYNVYLVFVYFCSLPLFLLESLSFTDLENYSYIKDITHLLYILQIVFIVYFYFTSFFIFISLIICLLPFCLLKPQIR